MTPPNERRTRQRRSTKKSPGVEAWGNVKALLWESIPLAVALALSWGFDEAARAVASSAGPEWGRATHAALIIVDLVAFIQLVVPKALVILNEIVALCMAIGETVALGLHRIGVAYRTGNRETEE